MHGDDIEEYYRARAPEYEQIYYRDNPVRRAEIDAEADATGRPGGRPDRFWNSPAAPATGPR